MSHTARIKMDGKLVGYLLLFSPLHYITISGINDVPITSEVVHSLGPCSISALSDCCIKDCALSAHLNINGADKAGLPGVFTVSL